MNELTAKIYPSCDAFFNTLKMWKTSNQKLVFTNGCFDLLHRGHIDSLLKSAALGDKLIVGLNTDRSVKQLKGSKRPLMDEQARALMLAALQMVDAVILFDEETPYDLIKFVQPDVLVKGNEYAIEEIAGYDIVLARGGTVETIELTKGYSTSALIQQIKDL
ncbi:rfaE bifunctional protein nucleotidyltransferase chain/domain [Sunxiuqinia elliptica]|uniref:D-glycero-beta-D-manno-heptose 1-phosphate adenylyltransferase n=2 Tax=Sunxiuqinia elliptica TaxID=655355 RepID=A0A4R6H5J0_9BACT|nr:rfaE bifunctional protein nucleotidyltransferase chain/domain [Sunxiuqinia elliptica]TDO58536.1 rfaE bifunctional protein nucleotidyltransferase chain/domain [Sunxiuqinia elliptica]